MPPPALAQTKGQEVEQSQALAVHAQYVHAQHVFIIMTDYATCVLLYDDCILGTCI